MVRKSKKPNPTLPPVSGLKSTPEGLHSLLSLLEAMEDSTGTGEKFAGATLTFLSGLMTAEK